MSNKNEFQAPLYATIELAVAMVENSGEFADLNDIDNADINVVHNADNQVALVLPYYSYLDNLPSAKTVSDDDFENVSGGYDSADSFYMGMTRSDSTEQGTLPEGHPLRRFITSSLRDRYPDDNRFNTIITNLFE